MEKTKCKHWKHGNMTCMILWLGLFACCVDCVFFPCLVFVKIIWQNLCSLSGYVPDIQYLLFPRVTTFQNQFQRFCTESMSLVIMLK